MSMADLYKQFSDVHPNIVLKTDVLRQGLKISKSAQQEFNKRDDILMFRANKDISMLFCIEFFRRNDYCLNSL
jgi:hypothetical protein